MIEDLSSNSLLQGIQQSCYEFNSSLPFIIYSDSGSNLLGLQNINEQTDEDIDLPEFKQLQKFFHAHNIILKPNVARASFRNSISESQVKLFKVCLKKSGLLNKRYTLFELNYICSKIQYQVNTRALNVNYINEYLFTISPYTLVFGSKGARNHSEIDYKNEKLFERAQEIDANIQVFENLYRKFYLQNIQKFRKWKNPDVPLEKDCVVIILDKVDNNRKTPVLGIIVEKDSQRTYHIQYIKREAKIDPNTYEIVVPAKKAIIKRAAQSLVPLVHKSECKNISLEYFDEDLDENEDVADNDEVLDEDIDANDDNEDIFQTLAPIESTVVRDAFVGNEDGNHDVISHVADDNFEEEICNDTSRRHDVLLHDDGKSYNDEIRNDESHREDASLYAVEDDLNDEIYNDTNHQDDVLEYAVVDINDDQTGNHKNSKLKISYQNVGHEKIIDKPRKRKYQKQKS